MHRRRPRAEPVGPRTPLRTRLLGNRTFAVEPLAVVADRGVWAALAALLVFQLLYTAFADPPVGIGDQAFYEQIGHHFGSWWFSGDARRTPGYPFLLAVTYKLGFGDVGTQVWQALLVVAATAAVAVLVGIVGGLRAARGAAWLQALYLPFFSYSSLLLSDVAAVSAGLVATLCVVLAIRREPLNYWWAVAAMALFLAATLMRPVYMVFTLVALAILVIAGDSWRSRAATVGTFAVTFLVLFGPWIGRNYARTSHPLVLGQGGNVQLAWGLHLPWDSRSGEFAQVQRSYDFYAGRRPDHFDEQKALRVEVWPTLARDLQKRPGDLLWSRVVAQYQLWVWPTTARVQYGFDDPVPFPLIMAEHLLFLVLGVLGLVLMRRHVVGRVMMLLVLITAGEYLFYYPGQRYTFAVMPFLVAAVAVSASWLWNATRRPSSRALPTMTLRSRPGR